MERCKRMGHLEYKWQSVRLRILVSAFGVRLKEANTLNNILIDMMKYLIRLLECTGGTEVSLYAYVCSSVSPICVTQFNQFE